MVKKRRTLRRWLHRLTGCTVVLAIGFAGYQVVTWPDVPLLAQENPHSTAFIDDNKRGPGPRPVQWHWVPYDDISPQLKRTVLVAEDINYFSHAGFETHEIRQAIQTAVSAKKLPRGASTITQQVAKNLWLNPSRNPWRKLKEAVLTAQLEHHLSKRRILEIYLNIAQMGPNIFGAEAAAHAYFDKPSAQLTIHEAAQLAATLSRPSIWNPAKPTSAYKKRVTLIEDRAHKAKWLDKEI